MGAQLTTAFSRRTFIASAAAVAVAACSGGKKAPKPGPRNLSGRIQVLTTSTSAPQLAVQQSLIEAFVRQYPDLGVDFIRVPDAAEARTRLTELTELKRPPDIVLPASGADLARFVDQDTWLDLRDYFRDDDVSLDDFPRVTRAVARRGDRVVGVPLGVHPHALAYNVDLFARAGVAPPDDSWTLETTFLDAARQLTVARSGQFGVGRFSTAVSFFGFGGRYYDAGTKRAQFDRRESIAGAQFASGLVATHRVQVPVAEEVAAWRAGKVAMIELSSADAAALTDGVAFQWRLAPLPAGPVRRHAVVDVQLGAIVAASSQHDRAWQLLRFLALDKERAPRSAAEAFGAIPVRPVPAATPAPWRAAIDDGSTAESAWMPAFGEVHELVDAAFRRIRDGASAAEVMPALQRDAQRAIAAASD